LGCLGDIMILSAIIDYELSLIYDIRASILKLLWCLERNWRILFVPLNFVNVGMPRWFYDLESNSRLLIVTQIWYMSLSFETIIMPPWPEMNLCILFFPLNFVNVGMSRWFFDLECNSRLWMPPWSERNWRILLVTLNFVNVRMPLVDFMIMSAIIDYELSLRYDIWA